MGRKWRVILISGLMAALVYGCAPLRLTPSGALNVRGKVVLSRDFPGGRAVLLEIDGGCFVGLVARRGPFWEALSGDYCAAERGSPFVQAASGSTVSGTPVLAFGGMVTDPRVARIRSGGQEQSVTAKGHFLFVWVNEWENAEWGLLPDSAALGRDGTVLFELNQKTGWLWHEPEP